MPKEFLNFIVLDRLGIVKKNARSAKANRRSTPTRIEAVPLFRLQEGWGVFRSG